MTLLAAMSPYIHSFVYELVNMVSIMQNIRKVRGMKLDMKEMIQRINRNNTWQMAELMSQCNQDNLHEILCLIIVDKVQKLEIDNHDQDDAITFIKWIRKINRDRGFKESLFIGLAAMLPMHMHLCFDDTAKLKVIIETYNQYRPNPIINQ